MNELDSDSHLLNHAGRTAHRDIVQFVPLRNFLREGCTGAESERVMGLLAKEVLAEVPLQLTSYMKMRNIVPRPADDPFPKDPEAEYQPLMPSDMSYLADRGGAASMHPVQPPAPQYPGQPPAPQYPGQPPAPQYPPLPQGHPGAQTAQPYQMGYPPPMQQQYGYAPPYGVQFPPTAFPQQPYPSQPYPPQAYHFQQQNPGYPSVAVPPYPPTGPAPPMHHAVLQQSAASNAPTAPPVDLSDIQPSWKR
nr:copine-8-like isoform 2 [Haemonchus contortus]